MLSVSSRFNRVVLARQATRVPSTSWRPGLGWVCEAQVQPHNDSSQRFDAFGSVLDSDDKHALVCCSIV